MNRTSCCGREVTTGADGDSAVIVTEDEKSDEGGRDDIITADDGITPTRGKN